MWRSKKAYLSCIMVLAIGLGVFTGMLSAARFFENSIEEYYRQSNFADVFVSVISMPKNAVPALEKIDGIRAAEGKLTRNIKASVEGMDDLISVKLVGVDLKNPPDISRFSYDGVNIAGHNDIWLNQGFLEAHNFGVGDKISLILDGGRREFNICGSVFSPEYIMLIPSDGSFPDAGTNTVGFVGLSVVERAGETAGMVSDIGIVLEDGYSFGDIRLPLENALEKYGLIAMVPREENPSHNILKSNVTTLTLIATIIPMIFLGMSIIMLYIMLKRFIEQERVEIGTLKAFGYNNREIISGYLIYGLITGAAGFLLSLFLGSLIGGTFYGMMQDFFRLPSDNFRLLFPVCMQGIFFSMSSSLLAVVMGARAIMHIQPAEAMRSAAADMKSLKYKFDGRLFRAAFNSRGIMAVRSLVRSRFRSILTLACVTFIFTLTNFLLAFNMDVTNSLEKHYTRADTSDMTINLGEILPASRAAGDAGKMAGVTAAEPMLIMPATLKNSNMEAEASIYGIVQGAQMYNIIDNFGKEHIPREDGIIMSRSVADKLKAKEKEKIEIESPYLRENVYVPVIRIIDESTQAGCYMELSALGRIFGRTTAANTVMIRVQGEEMSALKNKLMLAGNVAGYIDKNKMFQVAEENNGVTVGLITMLIVLSVVLCFGVIYNVSRISLGEKQRDLAVMRILGFTYGEVAEMNAIEQWILFFAGSLLGLVMSYFVSPLLSSLFNTENGTFNVSISAVSSALTLALCVVAVAFANALAKRQIKKFNLVEVLKERE